MRSVNKLVDENLLKLGAKYKNLCLVNPVISPGSKMEIFAKNYEDRYWPQGVSVQSALAFASALTLRGKMPFVCADAVFLLASGYKQVRDMIAYPNLNVKLIGLDAGTTLNQQGPAYHAIDDLSLILSLPNMKVFAPANSEELKHVLEEAAQIFGPVYIRISFDEDAEIPAKKTTFKEGNVDVLRKGSDITVFSYGAMLKPLLQIADELKRDDINLKIVNVSSLKPLNEKVIIKYASETKVSAVVEDHFVLGGLGSMLAKLFAEKYPTRLFIFGFEDFTDSNKKELIYTKAGLDKNSLLKKLKSLIKLA